MNDLTNTDLMTLHVNKKEIKLSHQCKIENGIEDDEIFYIKYIIGGFEQLVVVNQFEQFYTINPNQIDDETN